jgi:hypothetical protein
MRNLRPAPVLLLCLALPALASDHVPPPVQPATSFAAVEVHNDEKVAIAAEPYDSKEKESLFKVDYLSHGVMPVRHQQWRSPHQPARRPHPFPYRGRRQDSSRRA